MAPVTPPAFPPPTVANPPAAVVAATARPSTNPIPLAAAAHAGGAVAVALGTYGRVHDATGGRIATFGFPSVLPMKAWFATAAATLALVQLASALAMWGRLGALKRIPRIGLIHRWSGTVAFVVSLPVAYHCLWSLGFQTTDTRVLVHSVLGCAFYGAFATKLLVLRIDRLPRFTLPVVGGLLVALLSGLWLTSSLWFFTNVGFPGV